MNTFDSEYSIQKDILKKVGGDATKCFDSQYSILLEILDKIEGGGGGGAVIDDDVISTTTAWSSSKIVSEIAKAGFAVEVVQSLPATGEEHTLYFVPSSDPKTQNVYDEYLYVNNAWEKVGSTAVDMSNYYTKTEVDGLLANKANSSDVYDKTATDNLLSAKADVSTTYTKTEVDSALSQKQGVLTAGSNIQINNDVISATDTTYVASDFDIKDLADSTGLRTTWSAKQDTDTAVTHTANTQVGDSTTPVYINTSGEARPIGYTIAKSVPSDAQFTDTTYSVATQSTAGLMSATDKTKLDGLSNYVLPTASANDLGGVKVGSGLAIDANGVLTTTGGSGVQIDDNTPSTSTVYSSSKCEATFASKSDLEDSELVISKAINDLEVNKQDTLTAGTNITISAGVISATDTTYSDATQSTAGLMSATDKTKLDGLVNYTLPTASSSTLGGIKVGSGLSIDADGVLSATGGGGGSDIDDSTIATNKTWSSSKINTELSNKQDELTAGTNIAINNGVISATDTTYSAATQSEAGLMSATDKTKLDGLVNYVLPTASANDLGGVKVGSGLSIDANGVLSASGGVQIDDNTPSSSTVYSSSKCESLFAKVVTLTQAEYDALVTKDAMTLYIISDAQ